MDRKTLRALDRRLDAFLNDLLCPLVRYERRHWAKLYLQGLLLDGQRKSIEPMAARLGGVARQYCGTLGKVANCPMAVSLHWSSQQMSCPLSWRLYLPRHWIEAPPLSRLGKTARARWRVEMDYREMKEELGLDPYEGRHWQGWHHHVTLVTLAYAFLRSEQGRSKKNTG